MKLKDLYNMEEYLQNDCYCSGEIYDVSGFFFMVFNPEDECEKIAEMNKDNEKIVCVLCKDQLLNFWVEDNHITSAERYDATDNNLDLIKKFLNGESIKGMQIDEFKEGETNKNLKKIMNNADAIMI